MDESIGRWRMCRVYPALSEWKGVGGVLTSSVSPGGLVKVPSASVSAVVYELG